MIQKKHAKIVTVSSEQGITVAQVNGLIQQVDKLSKMNKELLNRLDRQPREDSTRKSRSPQKTSGYDPRLLGVSHRPREEKASSEDTSSRPSSKPGGSRSTR